MKLILETIKINAKCKTLRAFRQYIQESIGIDIPEPTIHRWLKGQSKPAGIYKQLIDQLIEKELTI